MITYHLWNTKKLKKLLKNVSEKKLTHQLMLAYGIGAVFASLFASSFMDFFGSSGLFIYFIVILVGLGAYLIFCVMTHTPSAAEDHQDFVVLPGTTPVASELDPCADK